MGLIPLPSRISTIGCCWVYAMNYLPYGSIERLKTHLVANSYTQNYGVKAMYNIKQSPKAWFGKFSKSIVKFEMHLCQSDHSIFSCASKRGKILLMVYVGDIIITGH